MGALPIIHLYKPYITRVTAILYKYNIGNVPTLAAQYAQAPQRPAEQGPQQQRQCHAAQGVIAQCISIMLRRLRLVLQSGVGAGRGQYQWEPHTGRLQPAVARGHRRRRRHPGWVGTGHSCAVQSTALQPVTPLTCVSQVPCSSLGLSPPPCLAVLGEPPVGERRCEARLGLGFVLGLANPCSLGYHSCRLPAFIRQQSVGVTR